MKDHKLFHDLARENRSVAYKVLDAINLYSEVPFQGESGDPR